MLLRPPRPTRTNPLCPYTTVFRSELLVLALLLSVGGGVLWRFNDVSPVPVPVPVPVPERAAPAAPASIPETAAPPAKSIAVLPFENLSRDPDNEYFVAGMQDLILTRLADIGDLRSEEHTSELQSLMRISYAVFCL